MKLILLKPDFVSTSVEPSKMPEVKAGEAIIIRLDVAARSIPRYLQPSRHPPTGAEDLPTTLVSIK